ncbi:MAG: single-stranded-DNA-specific exonuclease RecJ [Acidobacteriaceae bacterium]|nr:single-stranded-DNA-specific exonuclease RecJ [Acidobacteriaceae bacterium]
MTEVAVPILMRPAARWDPPPRPATEAIIGLQKALGLPAIVAAVLVARRCTSAAAAEEFLSPRLDALHDPSQMRDMDLAVARLLTAIRNREQILLYGDYDVDGTASIVILKKAIEILGGCADFHIPHRVTEGYGMRAEVIDRAAQKGVQLIVSVDTGIRANAVVSHARALGIDVIVTDHHLPEAELPPALAVLNPNRSDCSYPDKSLCGAGVTFKLVQALLHSSGLSAAKQAALLDSFLKPVAIATIADIVPLTGENRVIVRRGLSGLREVRNHGLRALLRVAGFDEGERPSAHQVAFRLAPRINAAGRMATAHDVIELFLTTEPSRAAELAAQLDALNRERQQTETTIVEAILEQCESQAFSLDAHGLVFAGSGWHPGVLGIVASRLVERFNRPVFVLTDAPTSEEAPCWSGSGRSIPQFHLLRALETMPELFTRFGGHRQAAGLTLPAVQLDAFRLRFGEAAAKELRVDDLRPVYAVDAEASFAELSDSSIDQLMALGPFGFGNPLPTFFARAAEVAGPPKALGEGKHLNVPLRHNGRMLFVKAWNFSDRLALFEPGAILDVLFQVEDDPSGRKRGYGSWCITLKDARPHASHWESAAVSSSAVA